MSDDTESFPVKYMVLRDDYGYWITDTSTSDAYLRSVCEHMTESYAHHICKLLNEAEGFRYEY